MTLARFGRAVHGWLYGFTLFRVFRHDRALAIATLVLAIAALAPLFATPFFPFPDLGYTIGMASLFKRLVTGDHFVQEYYRASWVPMPYWTGYVLIGLGRALGGVVFATRFTLGVLVLGLPLATMRLMVALRRSPRLGLWAFALAWDQNLYWGWVTFCLGMAIALVTIAKLIEARTFKQAAWVAVWSAVVSLTHVHAVVLLFAFGGLAVFLRPRPLRSIALHTVALSGALLMFAPWIFQPKGGGGAVVQAHFEYPPIQEKIAKLFDYSMENTPIASGIGLETIAFVLLVVGTIIVGSLHQKRVRGMFTAQAVAFLLAATILYLALPFAISGPISHWWTYPRYATYVLVGMLVVPRPTLDGLRALALVPGCVAALAVDAASYLQFADFSLRASPYVDVIKAIPEHSRVFSLDLAEDDKAARWGGTGHFHGFIAAETSSYDPHLFDYPTNPLQYRHENMPPIINWYVPKEFSVEKQGVYYDYIVVHPVDRDPLKEGPTAKGPTIHRVLDAGAWRVYKVEGALPYP